MPQVAPLVLPVDAAGSAFEGYIVPSVRRGLAVFRRLGWAGVMDFQILLGKQKHPPSAST